MCKTLIKIAAILTISTAIGCDQADLRSQDAIEELVSAQPDVAAPTRC